MEKIGNICSLLGIQKLKKCADLFEILVGAIFYYYFYKNHDYNIIHKIDQWIREITIFSEHVLAILQNKQHQILCPPLKK